MHAWGSKGDPATKLETRPDSKKISGQQRSAVEVVGKKKSVKQADYQAPVGVKDNDKAGGVKLNDILHQADTEQTVDDAAVAKKAKKAAKKARKAARSLESAKPPVGKKKEEDSEDDGHDSDWTQTSWSPSWASDSASDEE